MKDIFKLIFGFLIVFVIILLKPLFNIRIGKYPVCAYPYPYSRENGYTETKIITEEHIEKQDKVTYRKLSKFRALDDKM